MSCGEMHTIKGKIGLGNKHTALNTSESGISKEMKTASKAYKEIFFSDGNAFIRDPNGARRRETAGFCIGATWLL